ncbi:cyclopropane-fatty-acyl-phospholipid synthase family protein [Nocardioides sp.]|uniref:SAM-dependent methyltransferase n=1 Tax=Nocardioides sp. TaxID=35761 RepID=UPI0027256DD4|nr:cyclopropane-fatty-acyl-phospholipid synthase family protein [Nocardioides sp.]MDO9457156.1 cyclopropane-fatty-acyl-phospholipid synthase family protein [Nocardioides sp.]
MTVAQERVSANHWPGLDVVPSGPRARVSARIAKRLFHAAINRLDVTVVADGETFGRGGPTMVITRPEEFYLRIGRHQLIGFGEAYLTGAWDAEDLAGFLQVLAAEMQHLVPESLQKLRAVVVKRPPRTQKSTSKNSQSNIAHHYDLSNDLFELFLDPTLSYSSALFAGDPSVATAADLEEAQGRKIERLLDEAGVGEGTRVLEIGSGWGELCIRAARRGATITSLTLSVEQKALADERVAAAGFGEQCSVEICDYRDVVGSYDAIVSVEMIEAVGWQYWRTYFETIDRVLAPGGRVAIQAITMPHDRMLATRNTYTWINKYIFPGGFLPSVQVIDEITREHTGLRMAPAHSMGQHYARTLELWDEAFLSHSAEVLRLGFDDTFLRMWHFYLDYSRAGFASGYIDVNQLTFARD